MCIYQPMPKVIRQALGKVVDCIVEAGKPIAASAAAAVKVYLGKLRGRHENGTRNYKNY